MKTFWNHETWILTIPNRLIYKIECQNLEKVSSRDLIEILFTFSYVESQCRIRVSIICANTTSRSGIVRFINHLHLCWAQLSTVEHCSTLFSTDDLYWLCELESIAGNKCRSGDSLAAVMDSYGVVIRFI